MSDPSGPIRVLHVEDEPEFASLVADFIERQDDRITVEAALNAEEGLERLTGADFDCVVSDFEMPGMNGIDLLEAVREEHPDLPFILFTGKGSEEVASEAISVGVDDYLQKRPGSSQFALLANRIKNAVSKYRAERDVERTRTRHRRLIEEATDAIVVVDAVGDFAYVSPAAEAVLGYRPHELLGENGFDYIHEKDLQAAQEQFFALVEDPAKRPSVEFRFEQRDGSWRWIEVRGRNLMDDPVVDGIVVYAREVTDRKRRERELERQNQRLTSLYEATQDLILATDVTEVAERIVDAAARIIGLEIAAFYRPEDDTTLTPVAASKGAEDLFGEVPVIDSRDSVAWTVLESCDPVFADDLRERADVYNPATPIRSEMVVPVGDVGVFLAGSTAAGAFDDIDRSLVRVLTATAEAVLDRTEREELLRVRERKLDRLQVRHQRLMYAEDRTEAARIAVEAARDVIDAPLNGVHLLDESGDVLSGDVMTDAVIETFGRAPSYRRNAEPGTSDAVVWGAFEDGEALYIPDTHASSRSRMNR